MYWDYTELEKQIRDAAAKTGDEELLALSSEDMQAYIKAVNKDYLYIQKQLPSKPEKHLRIYSKAELCEMICRATKAILEAYANAFQFDWITKYTFAQSKSCDVTYDADLDIVFNAIYTIFNEDDITVQIDTYYMSIYGYVGCLLVAIEDLEHTPAMILFDAAEKTLKETRPTKRTDTPTSPDDEPITVDILA